MQAAACDHATLAGHPTSTQRSAATVRMVSDIAPTNASSSVPNQVIAMPSTAMPSSRPRKLYWMFMR
jgi:hypothetical protein